MMRLNRIGENRKSLGRLQLWDELCANMLKDHPVFYYGV